MNIEYTSDQIEEIQNKQSEIREQSLIARNASEKVLKATHELDNLHTKAATEFYKRHLANPTARKE